MNKRPLQTKERQEGERELVGRKGDPDLPIPVRYYPSRRLLGVRALGRIPHPPDRFVRSFRRSHIRSAPPSAPTTLHAFFPSSSPPPPD